MTDINSLDIPALPTEFEVVQGADFEGEVVLLDQFDKPEDLTGATATFEVRKSRAGSPALSGAATVDVSNSIVGFTLTGVQTDTLPSGKVILFVEVTIGAKVFPVDLIYLRVRKG